VPELSRFYGIVVRMYFDDHPPPHFHAQYGSFQAVVAIETLAVIAGELPPRARARDGMGGASPRRASPGVEPRRGARGAGQDRAAPLTRQIVTPQAPAR
jgi:hypothetical protein